MLPKQTHTLVF